MGEEIQRKVSIGNARISFLNGLALVLENVAIEEKDKKENLITSDRIIVSFYFFPLLKKQIAIKKVKIIRPLIEINLTKDGGNNILNWVNEIVPPQQVSKIQEKKLLLPLMKELIIKKGSLFFRDTQISDTPLTAKIIDLDLNIERTFFKKSIKVLIRGKIKSENKVALFRIKSEIEKVPESFTLEDLVLTGNINLNSLSIKQFQPYFKQYSGENKWDGTLDINVNYKGSFAGGFESIGEMKFESFGSSDRPFLSDPGKIKHWGINYDLFLNKKKLDIYDLKIKLNDLIFTGKSLIEAPLSKNPQISFALQSTPFNVQTYVKSIPFYLMPAPLRIFEDKLIRGNLKFESIHFKGNLNQLKNIHKQENFSLLRGKINAEKVDFRMRSSGPIFKKFSGTLEFKNGNLKFSNVSGIYKDSTISKFSCVILQPFERPMIDLSARASLQLAQIHHALLREQPILKNVWNLENITDISGRAEVQIDLSGNIKKPSEFSYSGHIEFNKIAFRHNDLVYPLRNINGKVRFYSQSSLVPVEDKDMIQFLQSIKKDNSEKGQYLYISSLSGRYGRSEIMNITGEISGVPSTLLFDLKIDSDINLKEIHLLLVSYLDTNGALEHLNKINIISGRSKLKTQISNHSSIVNEWDISGGLQLGDVHVSYDKFPLEISKLKGNIFFSNSEIEWKGLHGLIGKSAFSINGKTLNYATKNPKIDVQLNSEAHLNEIFDVLPLSGKENYFMNGIAEIRLRINGDYNSMETIGVLDLTQSSWQYKDWINKKTGKTTTINFDGVVERFNKIYFKEFKVTFGGNEIIGVGIVSDLKNPYLDIKIHKTNIDLADAAEQSEFLNKKLIAGKLTTSFNIKGHIKGEKQLEIAGKANLKGGSYKFDFSPNTIRNINADFDFRNQKIDINNAILSFGKSDANISGEISNFKKPRFTLKLKSKNFDLNQILPAELNSIKDINSLLKSSPLFLLTQGKIYLDAEKGQFRFLKFPHINGEIRLKDGLIIFNNMKAYFSKNHVTAKGLLDFISDDGLNFSLKLTGKSFPAKEFENIFENYFKNSVTGKLSLSTRLNGKGFNLEQITKSLFGKLTLLLVKGDYNKQNLISGTKQIIGFESERVEEKLPQGSFTEFDFIKGKFVINKGVAVTENYVIAAPKLRTSVIGALDLGNKKLDLSLGIAPWQKLNKAMSKIPIIGTILTGGDDKSLLINYYSVKGKMGSPKVKHVLLKSLGRKVISLVKGILQAPKEIIAPSR